MSSEKDEVFDNYMAAAGNSQAGDHSVTGSNLIVNYLPVDMLEKELQELFVGFGAIQDVKIVRSADKDVSLGYGFVNFKSVESAKLAQVCLNGRQVRSKILKVQIARPTSQEIQNAKLYVSRLPKEYGEAEVMNMFQRFGHILEIRIPRENDTGWSRGIAFVHFEFNSSAKEAISEMHQSFLPNGRTQISVELARGHKTFKNDHDFTCEVNTQVNDTSSVKRSVDQLDQQPDDGSKVKLKRTDSDS